MGYITSLLKGMFLKKTYEVVDFDKTRLSRCLSTFDLTALGIGTTLGAGVYVLTGKVAKDTAGPAVILSFVIAAIASVFAGLCYAEFGSRVPRTGSAYTYSYVSVGEFMAFVIGWNLILEFGIGIASSSKAWSANMDEVTGGYIRNYLNHTLPMDVPWLGPYPDFFAFLITIILTIVLSIGVKDSTRFNNILTVLNILVVVYAVVRGAWNLNLDNWKIPPRIINITDDQFIKDPAIGDGYFLPFGMSGVLSGAGTCFYGFVGFDSISATGEEVLNPQKSIPIAIIACLLVCCFVYVAVSSTITLMSPYYLINADAPLPYIFDKAGWYVSKYIVGFGALFGLSASLFGSLFALPRIIYAMSVDGLIFKFLSNINSRFKTPLLATVISGFAAAVLSAIFDLKALIDMLSIGTLLAYTLVAFSILILRTNAKSIHFEDKKTDQINKAEEYPISLQGYFHNLLKCRSNNPTKITDFISKMNSFILMISSFILAVLLSQDSQIKHPALLFFVGLLLLIIIFFCITLQIQPKNKDKAVFMVPFVPWIPTLSMFINLYLMTKLPIETWYRFIIWMILGLIIYFFYGICHSKEREKQLKGDCQPLITS